MEQVVDYRDIMNSGTFWLMCIPAVAVAVIQAILISKKAVDAGHIVGLTKQEAMKSFKMGAIAAIGPAFSSVVVMLTLMASVGGAFAWLRLCFIGSATTELTAAKLGAQAMGVELGGPGYGLIEFSNSVWACTLNAFGWLFMAGVFTPHLSKIKQKIVGDDNNLLNIISTSAMVGAFSFLAIGEAFKGATSTIIFLFSCIFMGLLIVVSKKIPKMKEHLLSIVLVGALILACILVSQGMAS